MPAPLRLEGKRFGRLVVGRRSGRTGYGAAKWDCVCDCGNRTAVAASSLTSGNTSSCGCVMKENIARQGRAKRTHGMSRSPEHNAWCEMHRRCIDPSRDSYPYYGGRGISVCVQWTGKSGFANFLADVGFKPTRLHSLERKDVDGNYEPGNCCWATRRQQVLNRRNNRIVTAFGRTAPLKSFIPGPPGNRYYKRASAKINKGVCAQAAIAEILVELAGGSNGY